MSNGNNAWGGMGTLGGDFSGLGPYGGDPTHGGGRSTGGVGTGGGQFGNNNVGSNAISVTADFIDPDSIPGHGAGSVMGPGLAHMGPGPAGNVSQTEGNIAGGYNANNMGGGTPGAPGGAPGGPAQNPGAGQMAGGMAGGPMSEGGGEPLITRLQGLTPQQQNFLLNDPQALAAFMREYDLIIQGGYGNQIGVGQMRDVDYTHGTYTVPSGLISQGTRPWMSDT